MPIKIQVASSDPLSTAVDVLVLGVPEGSPSGEGVLAKLQESLGEAVPKQLKRDDFSGKKDQSVEFTTYERVELSMPMVVKIATVELAIRNRLTTRSTRLRARSVGEIARQA